MILNKTQIKLLIVGIDGGDERIVRAMPMPFLQSFLGNNALLELKEDLWSRGWAEMLSGFTGRETGAFYSKPVLNGSHDFTQRFRSEDFLQNPKIIPLWTALEKLGHSIGFMNVPSTFPAPELNNGFFVSGAGGGLAQKGLGNVPHGVASSDDIGEILLKNEYVFDIRLKSSGIHNIDLYFDLLKAMVHRRTSAYLHLAKKKMISAGFLAYMALSRVQYVAMSEVEALIANGCQPANRIQQKIIELYMLFDMELRRLFEELDPKHFIVTADHGQAPFLHTVNVNTFLQQTGHLQVIRRKEELTRQGKNTIKAGLRRVVPEEIRFRLFKNKLNPSAPLKVIPDWQKTLAFGARYVPGIFINDARFNGPVKDIDRAKALVKEIVDALNGSHEAKRHGFNAHPYRQCYPEAFRRDLLPDIWIDHPDTCFFTECGQFIDKNHNYGPIKSLWQVTGDIFTGIKGSCPLVFTDKELLSHIEEKDPKDLTALYYLALRAMR